MDGPAATLVCRGGPARLPKVNVLAGGGDSGWKAARRGDRHGSGEGATPAGRSSGYLARVALGSPHALLKVTSVNVVEFRV